MNDPRLKQASMAQAAGVGAGGGAVVGALATLLEEKPTLRKALQNALIGGTGGAMIGSGVHALGDTDPAPPAPPAETPKPAAPPAPVKPSEIVLPPQGDPDKMNLGVAALTGLIPGAAPAIHGATQGAGQSAASGLSSMLPATAFNMNAVSKSPNAKLSSRTFALSLLLSSLGAVGAAHAGNQTRN